MHETHGSTLYFTLSNKYKNQYQELKEAKEKSNEIDEIPVVNSGYRYAGIFSLTIKNV